MIGNSFNLCMKYIEKKFQSKADENLIRVHLGFKRKFETLHSIKRLSISTTLKCIYSIQSSSVAIRALVTELLVYKKNRKLGS